MFAGDGSLHPLSATGFSTGYLAHWAVRRRGRGLVDWLWGLASNGVRFGRGAGDGLLRIVWIGFTPDFAAQGRVTGRRRRIGRSGDRGDFSEAFRQTLKLPLANRSAGFTLEDCLLEVSRVRFRTTT